MEQLLLPILRVLKKMKGLTVGSKVLLFEQSTRSSERKTGPEPRGSRYVKVAHHRLSDGLLPELQSVYPAEVHTMRSLRQVHHLPVTEYRKEHAGPEGRGNRSRGAPRRRQLFVDEVRRLPHPRS